jgi:hypothetical protein
LPQPAGVDSKKENRRVPKGAAALESVNSGADRNESERNQIVIPRAGLLDLVEDGGKIAAHVGKPVEILNQVLRLPFGKEPNLPFGLIQLCADDVSRNETDSIAQAQEAGDFPSLDAYG